MLSDPFKGAVSDHWTVQCATVVQNKTRASYSRVGITFKHKQDRHKSETDSTHKGANYRSRDVTQAQQ